MRYTGVESCYAFVPNVGGGNDASLIEVLIIVTSINTICVQRGVDLRSSTRP